MTTPDPDPVVDDSDLPEADLSEFERKLVEEFRPAAEDAATSGPVDDAVQPPAADAGVAPAAGALDFVEPVDDAPETAAPDTDAAPSASPPTAEELEDLWAAYGDRRDDAEKQARVVFDWYQQLSPDAVTQIDAVLSGQYVLLPAEQVPEIQRLYEESRKPRPAPSTPSDDLYDDDTSPVNEEVEQLRAQVAQLQEMQMRSQVNTEMQQSAAVIDAAAAEWREQHAELSDDDWAVVQSLTMESGIFAPLAQKYGDAQATKMALEQTLYGTPELRQKVLDSQVTQRTQAELEAIAEQQARAARASAISGASGAAASAPVSSDPDEAMVEEIRRAYQGWGSTTS